jgi:CHASE2 domain-containing sensor protein
VRFDRDGLVRRMAPFEADGSSLAPDLMTVVHRATKPFDAPDATRGEAPTLLIPFAGPPDRYRQVAFSSVLAGEVPRELIAGRTVFVGLTAPGLGPAFPTPVTPDAASMTGVQLQASVLDGLRGGTMIRPAGLAARLAFALSLLWLLLAGLLVLPPRASLLLLAVLLAAPWEPAPPCSPAATCGCRQWRRSSAWAWFPGLGLGSAGAGQRPAGP